MTIKLKQLCSFFHFLHVFSYYVRRMVVMHKNAIQENISLSLFFLSLSHTHTQAHVRLSFTLSYIPLTSYKKINNVFFLSFILVSFFLWSFIFSLFFASFLLSSFLSITLYLYVFFILFFTFSLYLLVLCLSFVPC